MASFFKNNFYLFFFGIFAFVGSCLGIAGAWFYLDRNALINDGVQTVGVVTELVRSSGSNTQAPVVEFNLKNGERHTFTSSLFSSPPAYTVGESVELWYNPKNPDEVALSGMESWLLPLIFGIFFLVFGGIGWGGLIYLFFKKRDIAWLKQQGHAVEADFTGVRYNTSVKMNGASPFVIQSQWHDKATNKMYVFESDSIWYDPTAFINGKTIRVLIDPKNPGLYYMDISFLPESGN